MDSVWDIIYLRRPVLNYVSPPVCEVIFSGSSSPIIVLSERPIGQVTGAVLSGEGVFQLSWNAFPGALCYNVYFIGGDNVAVPLAQCITDPFFNVPPGIGPGELVITPITLEGEGPPSTPVLLTGGGGIAYSVYVTGCTQASVDNFPVAFLIHRDGTSGSLLVNFTLSGSAVNGTDYSLISTSATILDGASSVSVYITPIEAALLSNKTVTLTLNTSPTYFVEPPTAADMLLRPALFKISNYGGSEPLFTPPGAAVNASYCEWDGSVNTFFGGGPPDSRIFAGEDGSTVLTNASVQGKQLYIALTSGPGPAPNTWYLVIDCLNGTGFPPLNIPVWRGTKIGGLTPAGIYLRASGSDVRAAVTLEAVP